MNEEKDFLGTEPVGRLLFRLAVPTVTAQLINMLYNIVDRIYIGHIPEEGAMALTGVGVCMPLIMIVSAFAAFVAYGGAPRATIFMGKGEYEKAEETLGNCFVVQVIISALLTAALLLWNRDFLLAFGASANTVDYGVAYMNIYALGTIFVQMTLGMNAFITAQGFARTGMLSVLIGAVANIILVGVRGAALATILSQAMSCAWVLLFLVGKKTHLRIRVQNMKLQKAIVAPCLALGLSNFVMQASESVISVCFNSSLLRYGGDIAVFVVTFGVGRRYFVFFGDFPLHGYFIRGRRVDVGYLFIAAADGGGIGVVGNLAVEGEGGVELLYLFVGEIGISERTVNSVNVGARDVINSLVGSAVVVTDGVGVVHVVVTEGDEDLEAGLSVVTDVVLKLPQKICYFDMPLHFSVQRNVARHEQIVGSFLPDIFQRLEIVRGGLDDHLGALHGSHGAEGLGKRFGIAHARRHSNGPMVYHQQ